jgi:hypothetical protein
MKLSQDILDVSYDNFFALVVVALVRDSLAPIEDHSAMLSEARQLREVVTKIAALRLDHTEYTCLKAITLFKPGKTFGMTAGW